MNRMNHDEEKYMMMAIQSVLFLNRKIIQASPAEQCALSLSMAKQIVAQAKKFQHITESIDL